MLFFLFISGWIFYLILLSVNAWELWKTYAFELGHPEKWIWILFSAVIEKVLYSSWTVFIEFICISFEFCYDFVYIF